MDIYATKEQMEQLADALWADEGNDNLALHVEDCIADGLAYFSLTPDEDDYFITFASSIHDLRWMAELVKHIRQVDYADKQIAGGIKSQNLDRDLEVIKF